MDAQEKFDLIAQNTQEIVGLDHLKAILEKRDLKVYWGTACTGSPSIGYFVPAMKLRDLLNAGCEVTILLADLHALLDDLKTGFDLLEARVEYYKVVLTALLESIGADVSKLRFIKGSDYQLKSDYSLDMLKLASLTTEHDCKKAAAEVVRFGDNPKLGGSIYPIMQALDEQYLDVDAQYGGIDQRKIFMFAKEALPKLKYKKRIHIMTPMVPGLTDTKMSSSEENAKIDLLEEEKKVVKKINKAPCQEGVAEDNGVLAFVEKVIAPLNNTLLLERPEKFGGNLEFKDFEELKQAFINKKLHPVDLKQFAAAKINELLEPIRLKMADKQDLIDKAYN